MENIVVTAAAKRACNDLAFIAEKTDCKIASEACIEAIETLCRSFNIKAFGSLPNNSNSGMPRSASIAIGDSLSANM